MKKITLLPTTLFVILFLIVSIFFVTNKTLAEDSWNVDDISSSESNVSTCQFVNLLIDMDIISSDKADQALSATDCKPSFVWPEFATTTTATTTLNSWEDVENWGDEATTTDGWWNDILDNDEGTTTATSTNTVGDTAFSTTTTATTTLATTTVSSRYQVFFSGYIEKIEDCLSPNPNRYKMITIKPCGGSGNIVSSVNSAPEPGGPMKYASDYRVSPGGSLTGLFYPGYGDPEPRVGDSVLGVADSNHEARCLTAFMKAAKIEVSSLGKSVGIVKEIGAGPGGCSVAPNQNNNGDGDWLMQLIQILGSL
jgi:hypothetical protein